MLHRLADREAGTPGTDPEELRQTLGFLRRRGYPLVSVEDLLEGLRHGDPARDLGVAFTLDDGYREQAHVAGPIFAEFDCPATVFLTTGFVDGELWQWWDKVDFIVNATSRSNLRVEIGRQQLSYPVGSPFERAAAQEDFTARCKRVPDAEKHAAILRLADAGRVELPVAAPARYQPLTWDDVRAWEPRGLSFGPHTVTHPILSKTEDQQCRAEIFGSWSRLKQMASRPVRVFCYPNGGAEDLGERELRFVREAGLVGALTTTVGYASVREFRSRPETAFLVRRYPYPDDRQIAALYASGADRLRRGLGESR